MFGGNLIDFGNKFPNTGGTAVNQGNYECIKIPYCIRLIRGLPYILPGLVDIAKLAILIKISRELFPMNRIKIC